MAPWEAHERPDLLGFGMTLVAGGCYGVGWTYLRRFLAREDLGGLSLPAAQLLAAAGQMLLVLGGWWLLHREQVSWPFGTRQLAGSDVTPAVLALAALGVVGTVRPRWRGIPTRSSGRAANMRCISPSTTSSLPPSASSGPDWPTGCSSTSSERSASRSPRP